nr:MAG TPA: hypothetical protein [Caudoviricetes sp.]
MTCGSMSGSASRHFRRWPCGMPSGTTPTMSLSWRSTAAAAACSRALRYSACCAGRAAARWRWCSRSRRARRAQ